MSISGGISVDEINLWGLVVTRRRQGRQRRRWKSRGDVSEGIPDGLPDGYWLDRDERLKRGREATLWERQALLAMQNELTEQSTGSLPHAEN
jgi:hypothetical protein